MRCLCPYVLVYFSFFLLEHTCPCNSLTVHFNFTEANRSAKRVPLRIRMMSPVVVVDDVSPLERTADVDRIRYRGSGVVGVPKTQYSVLFVCRVGDVDRESQEDPR